MSLNKRHVVLRGTGLLFAVLSLIASSAFAAGSAVITGTVTDAATKQPIADVVVTATSPNLQGEQVVVTDATGVYRIPQLPPGVYTIRLEKEAYKPYSRGDIAIRSDTTTRVNVELLPEALKAEEIVVVGRAPTVDVGSTTTGVNVSSDFIRNIAVVAPGARGGAARSFESLAVIAPGAQSDLYGVSISGTTSPENQYVIDGLSVNDPGFGLNATPLTVDFIQEVNVITGGYMPEYGRATGGIMNVVTKSGSNEFHGSVFGNWTPGVLEGAKTPVRREGTTITTNEKLWNLGDFGVELGGPILKDRLWFYAGFAPSLTRNQLTRQLNVRLFDAAGNRQRDEFGFTVTKPIDNSTTNYFADQRTYQYIGKLTYLINQDHNLTLSVYGTPTSSGGPTSFGIDPQTGATEVCTSPGTNCLINGPLEALAHRRHADSTDVSAKLASSFADKRILLDATFGWHHQAGGFEPVDGSAVGSNDGLAGTATVVWRRTPKLHTIGDFETLSPEAAAACDAPGTPGVKCPVTRYVTGGPGFLGVDDLNRYQGRLVGTYLLNLVGHHVIKAGVDAESVSYHRLKAWSGGVTWRESTSGSTMTDFREYGYLVGPDQATIAPKWDSLSKSSTIGGFLQDSWNVLDLVTINAGVRYDTQTLVGADNKVALVLPNQISPRVGLVYDFTQQGRSKLFANYARFYENALLDMIDRGFPGERQIGVIRQLTPSPATGRPGCNPTDPQQQEVQCMDPRNLRFVDPYSPNSYYFITGGDKNPVDPNLKNQSSDEYVLGGEYEVITDARAGLSYTRRRMLDVIEDMSRDEATTYFIGNPGSGIASDFPKATRNYDAFTVYINKNFSDLWLGQVSYTYSRLVGNYAGLFRPETGQLDPNINSDFDLISLLENRTGPLPGDRTHQFKFFGAKEFVLSGAMSFQLGLTYTARSGAPMNYFGSHPIYGSGEVYILPRGSGGRLPWIHNFDSHLGFNYKLSKDSMVTLSVDVFNLFNLQGVLGRDQTYTQADVNPLRPADCAGGKCTAEDLPKVTHVDVVPDCPNGPPNACPLSEGEINPNFKNVTSYQAPRSIRFGAKVTF